MTPFKTGLHERNPSVSSGVPAGLVGTEVRMSASMVSPPPVVAWIRVVAIGRPPPPVRVAKPEEEGEGGIGVVIWAAAVVVDLGRVFIASPFNNSPVAHIQARISTRISKRHGFWCGFINAHVHDVVFDVAWRDGIDHFGHRITDLPWPHRFLGYEPHRLKATVVFVARLDDIVGGVHRVFHGCPLDGLKHGIAVIFHMDRGPVAQHDNLSRNLCFDALLSGLCCSRNRCEHGSFKVIGGYLTKIFRQITVDRDPWTV
jgi:hypothetical protein